jgi:hypothetical protein
MNELIEATANCFPAHYRKVIQLMTDDNYLYALCNDGTIWRRHPSSEWKRLQGPPQS